MSLTDDVAVQNVLSIDSRIQSIDSTIIATRHKRINERVDDGYHQLTAANYDDDVRRMEERRAALKAKLKTIQVHKRQDRCCVS